MDKEQIKELARTLASGKPYKYTFTKGEETFTEELSTEKMDAVLREDLCKKMNESATSFERYKLDYFDLIQESVDIKSPKQIQNWFDGFAEVKIYDRNDKPQFSITRAKNYLRERGTITQVSRAGVYEVFKLPQGEVIDIQMKSVGGAAQVSYEDYANGRVDWNLLIDIITMGIQDRVYDEILNAFSTIEKNLPANNKATSSNFEAKSLEKVLSAVQPYGQPVIFCTETFAREITEGANWASEEEKKARRSLGYLANYKGAKIVILPQTWEDETNAKKKVDDSKAYILPDTGDRPIKLCFQGPTNVKEVENSDWSKEIHAYRSMGAIILASNDIATYEITSLKG